MYGFFYLRLSSHRVLFWFWLDDYKKSRTLDTVLYSTRYSVDVLDEGGMSS